VVSKIGSSPVNFAAITQTATDDYDTLALQFVSDPISAQTITGTIKGQIKCLESSALANFSYAIVVKVVSGDGSTVRGTLYTDFSDTGAEFDDATRTNRKFPAAGSALGSVVAQAGDRIVIEIGARKNGTNASSRTATLTVGDSVASDLPEDEVETGVLNPWIEFSQTIKFSIVSKMLAHNHFSGGIRN